jgi:glycerol-3-phosphate acyltransferase PlsY
MLIKIIYIIFIYLIGGIPFGFLAGKIFKGIDIREHGSKNVGATNVFRVVGKGSGLLVYLLDALKGFLPVLISKTIWPSFQVPDQWFYIGVGIAAILGHIFTPYLKFKGGKGVAVASGVVLALEPISMLIALGAFVIVLISFGYVSLGSIVASLVFPISAAVIRIVQNQNPLVPIVALGWLITLIIIVTHKNNIMRLLNKTENKFGFKGNKIQNKFSSNDHKR